MRVPDADWLYDYMRAFGLVALGIIIGSALFMAVYHHNFSLLVTENAKLKTDNDEMRKTLEPFLKNKANSAVVRQIKFQLYSATGAMPLDEMAALGLKKQLTRDLEALRGRPIESAAETLIVAQSIIERKVYTIDQEQEFMASIKLMLIKTGEITLWVEFRPYIRSD